MPSTIWTELAPQSPYFFFMPQDRELAAEYLQGWVLAKAMPINNIGMNSHRDAFAVAFDASVLEHRLNHLIGMQSTDDELRLRYELDDTSDFSLARARTALRQAVRDNVPVVQSCLYRPFDMRYVLYHAEVLDRPRDELNRHFVSRHNLGLVTTRQTREQFGAFAVDRVCGQHKIVATYDGSSIFPLYLFPEPGKPDMWARAEPRIDAPDGRHANLAPAFIDAASLRLGLTWVADGRGDLQRTFGPEDVFNYLYAILYSPTYRARYAEFLKTDFPCLPLTDDVGLFIELCGLGSKLVALHLMEHTGPRLASFPTPGDNRVEQARYMAPGEGGAHLGRVWVNANRNVSRESRRMALAPRCGSSTSAATRSLRSG